MVLKNLDENDNNKYSSDSRKCALGGLVQFRLGLESAMALI